MALLPCLQNSVVIDIYVVSDLSDNWMVGWIWEPRTRQHWIWLDM